MAKQDQGKAIQEDNTLAVIAYLTIIGWLMAFMFNRSKSNTLVYYHEQQSLPLQAFFVIVLFIGWMPLPPVPFLDLFIIVLLFSAWIAWIVLTVLGILNALSAKKRPLPILGAYAMNHVR